VIWRVSNFIPITASAPNFVASAIISWIASRRHRTNDGIGGRDGPLNTLTPSVKAFAARAVTPMTSPMT
jgi:hypothetical protein